MASDPEKVRQHRELAFVRAISKAIDAAFPPPPSNLFPTDSRASLVPSVERTAASGGSVGPGESVTPGGSVWSGGASGASEPDLPYGLGLGQAGQKLTLALGSSFPSVRKEAASALGKLSRAYPKLKGELSPRLVVLSLMARIPAERNPQVRQYVAKALGKYGAEAAVALDDLRDQARDSDAPAYVRTAAAEAIAGIQLANREQLSRRQNFCRRCHRQILPEEYLSSMNAYGHCYCRHCADEIALESQNFELMIDEAKRKRTLGGTAVQSRGEKRIAEFLERERIAYSYDARYRVAGDVLVRPDFYLPEFDLYIEYWGMDTPAYNRNMEKKRFLYQRAGKKLISVSWRDLENVEEILRDKLSRHVRLTSEGTSPCDQTAMEKENTR